MSNAGAISLGVVGGTAIMKRFDTWIQKTPNPLRAAVNAACLLVEAEAKQLIRSGYYAPAIDTGTLRNSITHRVDPQTSFEVYGVVGVGASVYYGRYVHDGTAKMARRPFLADAANNKKRDINKTFVQHSNKLFTMYGNG